MGAILAPRARADLRRALRWLARDSTDAAQGLNDLVDVAAGYIGANPAIGSRRPMLVGEGFRVWPLQRHPYLLVYTDKVTPPRIVRIVHTARDLPAALADLRV